MSYDLVIKNGTVIDGTGLPRYRADVGVVGGQIAHIGRIRESAKETIDAEGQVVTPGFVDGHTHGLPMRCISMKNSGGAARERDALVGALMLWRCAALRRIESSIAQG